MVVIVVAEMVLKFAEITDCYTKKQGPTKMSDLAFL